MNMRELKPATQLAAKQLSRFKNETSQYSVARTALLAEENRSSAPPNPPRGATLAFTSRPGCRKRLSLPGR